MGRFNSIVVVFFLALVLRTSPAEAIDCKSVISNVFPCSTFLKNPNSAVPESSCCNAATNWIGLGDADSLCKCFQPIASQFFPLKAQQLHGLCNLGAAHLPLVKCLAPQLESTDGLPFALPPLPFHLPPLPFPLPPLLFPLPPLPFVPPAENQEKKSEDDLLPPLPPLVPLPALPTIPLPPLPKVPLPPLPFVPPAEEQEKKSQNGLLPPLPPLPLPPLPTLPLPPLPKIPLPPLPMIPLPPLPTIPLPPLPTIPLPPLPFVPPAEKHN